jgi:hypothetical protein
MARRLIITAGWLAAAVLAVLVGLLAVSLIGDGLTSPIAQPMSRSDVNRELQSLPSAAPPARPSIRPSVPATPASTAEPLSSRTRGGTVIARCDGGRPVIVSMTPAQGFEVHERDGDEGEFRSITDNHDRVKIDVRCAGSGKPAVSAADERDDD